MAHRRDQNRLNTFFRNELRSLSRLLAARLLISGSLPYIPRRFDGFRSESENQFVPPCDELVLADAGSRASSPLEAVPGAGSPKSGMCGAGLSIPPLKRGRSLGQLSCAAHLGLIDAWR